jgi:hypothetical protein
MSLYVRFGMQGTGLRRSGKDPSAAWGKGDKVWLLSCKDGPLYVGRESR